MNEFIWGSGSDGLKDQNCLSLVKFVSAWLWLRPFKRGGRASGDGRPLFAAAETVFNIFPKREAALAML